MLVSWTIPLIYHYQLLKNYKKKEWTEAMEKKIKYINA